MQIDEKKAGIEIFISDKFDFKTKHVKRKGRTLHNNEGMNPRREHNNLKYLCTQHKSTSIYETIINRHKVRYPGNMIIEEDFNTPFTSMDRSSR